MAGKPQQLATAEVGKPLGYEHFQIHRDDVAVFDKLGRDITPHPQVAVSKIELLTVGSEGDIMDWFLVNWTQSIVYSIVYVVFVFAIQRIMKNREKFDLRGPLIVWSGLLALFSIAGAVRGTSDMIFLLVNHGFYHTVCNPSCFYGVPGFWALMFVLSKVVELGDTAFIVLRKQPLIFLHWYHHVTVLVYSWLSYAHHTSPGRWYTIMNLNVHAVMYSYYTLRAMRFRVPRPIMMGITILQLSQMVVGLYVNIYAYNLNKAGITCHISSDNIFWSFVMYLSYFVLFLNYFYNAYLKPKSRSQVANGSVSTKLASGANISNGSHVKTEMHMNGKTHQTNGHTKKDV